MIHLEILHFMNIFEKYKEFDGFGMEGGKGFSVTSAFSCSSIL